MASAIAVIAIALTATNASAATTRAEYVAQVEPICQAGLAQETAAAKPVEKKLRRLKKHAHSRNARRRALKREMRTLARFYDFVATVEQGVNARSRRSRP